MTEEEIRALQKEVKILKKKLERSENNRMLLERTMDKESSMLNKLDEVQKELALERAQLSSIIENIPEVVYRCSAGEDLKVYYLSDRIKDITGYPSSDYFEGKLSFASLIHEDDIELISSVLTKAVESGNAYDVEYRIVLAGGTIRWIQDRGKWINDENHDEGGYLDGIMMDVTEKKEAEEALQKQFDEMADTRLAMLNMMEDLSESMEIAEAANEAKSLFLANMSHEIRTPMNAVLGFSEILDGLLTDPQHKEYLASIKSSGKSLLGLINDILDLSKVEAGKLELEYTAVDVHAVLTEMKQIFSQKVAEKGLDFIVEVDENLPRSLVLDEVRLRQVLLNLIGNAVKFTSDGHVKLSVTNLYPEKDRSSLDLVFSVEDTGIGIPDEQKDKIFGAFEQQTGQSTKEYGGTGLGLAITKRLIEMMNGSVNVTGEVGKGSIFSITLKGIAVASIADLDEIKEGQVDADSVTFEKATLLVVDDIEVNRRVVSGFLEPFGFTLLEAENGKEAIQIVQLNRPSLVLMDMKMPVMNGYEATSLLKADPETKDIPVVALTASTMKESEAHIRKVTDGYLRKPVTRNDLISELVKFLPHEIIGKEPEQLEETGIESAIEIDSAEETYDAALDKLPDLLEILENKRENVWKELMNTLTINEIEDFAKEMKEYGLEYGYPPLTGWAKQLENQAAMFEIDAMSSTLESFPEIIQKIKTLIE
ncbi:ATP-binding protein [candidate division KSB1 bacterium]